MLNWMIWTGTFFDIETVYSCETELFEIELFWHLNCVLMSNWFFKKNCLYVQRWIWHWITYNGWCATKPNQIKPYPISLSLSLSLIWPVLFLQLLKSIKTVIHSNDYSTKYWSVTLANSQVLRRGGGTRPHSITFRSSPCRLEL